MNDKLKMLQCFVESRMFAPSSSALAKMVDYTGKSSIYRVPEGKVSQKLAGKILEKIKDLFDLEDESIDTLYLTCRASSWFYKKVVAEVDTQQPRWAEKMIESFMKDDYEDYSLEFAGDVVATILNMRRDNVNVFYGMLTLFYLRAKKVEPYQKNFVKTQCDLFGGLDRLLYALYPENDTGHQTALIYQDDARQHPERRPSICLLLQKSVLLFHSYKESDYASQLIGFFRLFDWPEQSYWTQPGTAYGEGAEVWQFVEYTQEDSLGGYYIGVKLRAGANIEEFTITDICLFHFVRTDNEDDEPIVQTTKTVDGQKHFCHYLYEYDDDDKRVLRLTVIPEWGDLHGLSGTLRRIDLSHPEGKDERVWSRILTKHEDDDGDWDAYVKAVEAFFGKTNLSDQYEVTDVIVSRSHLTLVVNEQDVERDYRLPIEAYSFLTEITPSQEVIITRHTDDDEMYAEWPFLGYAVRLSEFTELFD